MNQDRVPPPYEGEPGLAEQCPECFRIVYVGPGHRGAMARHMDLAHPADDEGPGPDGPDT